MPLNKSKVRNHNDEIITAFKQDYFQRKQKNSRYSLRSYAHMLGIPSGRLSEFLSGKRKLTSLQIDRVIQRIPENSELHKKLISIIGSQVKYLRADEIQLISDEIHFSILALLETDDFVSDHRWIADRLGETNTSLVKLAIERLLRLDLIKLTGQKYTLNHAATKTSHDIPSSPLRESHKKTIQQSINSLDNVPVELRDITSITMAIDITKIAAAKKRIKKFRKDMSNLLESGNRSEVYNLNVQLVPVTKIRQARN